MDYNNNEKYRDNNAVYVDEDLKPIPSFSKFYKNYISKDPSIDYEFPSEFESIYMPENRINNCFDIQLSKTESGEWEYIENSITPLQLALDYNLFLRGQETIENFMKNKESLLNNLVNIKNIDNSEIPYGFISIDLCNINGTEYGLINEETGGYIAIAEDIYNSFNVHQFTDLSGIYYSCYNISGFSNEGNLYIDCGGGDGGYGRSDKLIYNPKTKEILSHQMCEHVIGSDVECKNQ